MNTHEYRSLSEAVLDIFGSNRHIIKKYPLQGGDISAAYAAELDDGTLLFIKTNAPSLINSFRAEAAGLAEIAKTHTVRTPEVLGIGSDSDNSFLLLEYISAKPPISRYWDTLGEELAALHRADLSPGIVFGYESDNYIGTSPQINTPNKSWILFFRDCRLIPQFQAVRNYFNTDELSRISRLLSNLDRYLIEPDHPSLLHGDLWIGNILRGSDGKAWLIDPAVYYGHSEADLAMTELFGGFPYRFYQSYWSAVGMDPGYKDRKDIYNLYHLINHLRLFGGAYLTSVLSIISHYT